MLVCCLKYVRQMLIADRLVCYTSFVLVTFVLDCDLFVQHKKVYLCKFLV
jgi:hypothetical protein